MRTTNFNIRSMSEQELTTLAKTINDELEKRSAEKEAKRAVWIEQHFRQFHRTYNATCITREKLTVVSVYTEMDGLLMGTAYPINGDVYDHKTGIAVAFAKACGEAIPYYI